MNCSQNVSVFVADIDNIIINMLDLKYQLMWKSTNKYYNKYISTNLVISYVEYMKYHSRHKCDMGFPRLCSYGCIDLALYIYDIEKLDLDTIEYAFRLSVCEGQFEISKLLYTEYLKRKRGLHRNNKQLFIYVCSKGWLDFAKWFYELDNYVHLSNKKNDAFIKAKKYQRTKAVEWLESLPPH